MSTANQHPRGDGDLEKDEVGQLRHSQKRPADLAARLRSALSHDSHEAARAVARMPSARVADAIQFLSPADGASLLRNMHALSAAAIVARMNVSEAADRLARMPPDDRVDILDHLPADAREHLIHQLSEQQAAEVRHLEGYPPETAGGIMTTDMVALSDDLTAEQAVSELRRLCRAAHQINYVYVTDGAGCLTGVLSMRELILAPAEQLLRLVQRPKVIAALANMDQEDVARVIRRHAYLALPVVDDSGKLLGVITADDVADVLEDEATEDIQKIGGTDALNAPYFVVGLRSMIRKRAGWLSVLFVGEMLTATAMGYFESHIQRAAMVALFVPLIVSSGGNSGSQATTIVIRSLALGEIQLREWWRVCAREFATGLSLGLLLGMLGGLRVLAWYYLGWHEYSGHPYRMAAAVSTSLVGIVCFGSVIGSMLPMILRRMNLDPASASAPFVATLVDVAGLVLYFMLAIAFLSGPVF